MHGTTEWPKNLRVEVRGDDVVGHGGCVDAADAGGCDRAHRGIVGGAAAAGGDP